MGRENSLQSQISNFVGSGTSFKERIPVWTEINRNKLFQSKELVETNNFYEFLRKNDDDDDDDVLQQRSSTSPSRYNYLKLQEKFSKFQATVRPFRKEVDRYF